MNKLGVLLGSATRGNVVEALAVSKRPLTAYRVAKEYNMNVAKVYVETKRLAALGLIRASRTGRGVEYRLADGDLKRLALKLSSRTVPFEEWSSEEERASRFRQGLRRVPKFTMEKPDEGALSKTTRLPGELDTLAALARTRFDRKYRRTAEREFGLL